MLEETIKKDLRVILNLPDEEVLKVFENMGANRIKTLEKDRPRVRFVVTDVNWLNKKIEFIKQHGVTRLFELLNELYKQGYKLTGVNKEGFDHGMLYIRAADQYDNRYIGYVDLTGNLTLSIKEANKFIPVLRLLYRGKTMCVKDTALQAVLLQNGLKNR